MNQYFQQLAAELPNIKAHTPINSCDAFFKDEVMRFHSIAGTVEMNFRNIDTSIDERILTHILIRSLIENYFRLLYIYDKNTQARFNEVLDNFKVQYSKLYNEVFLPHKAQLEPPDPAWSSLKAQKDLNSMIAAVMNVHQNRLSYLYFVYRVASFDTHGNSLAALFNASFNKATCNFPVLKISEVIDLIANEYLVIWSQIKKP